MGYERSGLAVVPQASWESLFTANAPENHRCRDCQAYADPAATHSDCTFRGIRKAGYAGACRTGREPNGRPSRKRAGVGFIPRDITITPTREDMSMTDAPTFACDVPGCERVFERAHGLAVHVYRSHAKHTGLATPAPAMTDAEAEFVSSVPLPTVAVPKQAPVAATPTPTVLASVFVTPDTIMTPAELVAMIAEQETCPDSLAELEEDADAFAEAVTVGAMLAMARAEIAELRIELMMLALGGKLGDDAERFASEYVFPAIEAAELAAEVAA